MANIVKTEVCYIKFANSNQSSLDTPWIDKVQGNFKLDECANWSKSAGQVLMYMFLP